MGDLIVLGIFAYSCVVVVIHELTDIVIDKLLRRLPR